MLIELNNDNIAITEHMAAYSYPSVTGGRFSKLVNTR